jgi:hypothetical protein
VALAPLDVVLGTERPYAYRDGLIFMMSGVTLLVLVLLTERKRTREH